MNSIFSRILIISLLVITISSCDKDANDIGANIIGADHFGFSSYTDASIVAFNQATGEIQTDNLEVNQLGIYDNPVFGKTVASVAVQLQLSTTTPFPDQTVTANTTRTVKSVVLEIPYFSHPDDATAVSPKAYTLDSIIGTKTNKIKLSVFRIGTDIRNRDENQGSYYSDADFDSSIIGTRLNDNADASQNDDFFFDKNERSITTTTSGTTTTTYTAPTMRLNLNNALGTEILGMGSKLLKNDEFVNAYKGLFFKVEQSGTNEGCLAMLNFKKGTVTITYDFISDTGAAAAEKTLVLNLTGNSVNILQHTNSTTYASEIASPNSTSGDKKLFLKGGNGSVAYIDLFDAATDNVKFDRATGLITNGANFVPDELDYLKAKGWLINEANLVFNIDETTMGTAPDPNRILVYNANNKIPVIDYSYDNTTSTKANYGKIIHGGMKNGSQYKVRITNHIRNIINKDSTNVRLGVCVNQNINNIYYGAKKGTTFLSQQDWAGYGDSQSGKMLKNAYTSNFFPTTSIMNPLGTVLYGNNFATTDADYAKRLKLEIWYTKP